MKKIESPAEHKVIPVIQDNPCIQVIRVIPLVFLSAVIPLIIHLKIIPVDQAIQNFWNQGKQNSDYFSYYKSIFIITASAITLVALLIGFAAKRSIIEKAGLKRTGIKRTKVKMTVAKKSFVFVAVAISAICIVVSTIFSEYMHTSLFGFPDRYEGALVLLSYLIFLLVAIILVKDEKQIKIIIGSLLISSAIIGTIGLLQVFGLDIFDTEPGKSLILSGKLKDFTGSIRAADSKYTVVSTLYSSNASGQYMSMLFPLVFSLFVMARVRKLKILAGLLSCLFFANLIGSNSRAGFISITITSIIIAVYLRKIIISRWKQSMTIMVCFILIFAGINYVKGGYTGSWLSSAFTAKDIHPEDNVVDKIKNFKMKDNQLVLECTHSELTLDVSDNKLRFLDENGIELTPDTTGQNDKIVLKEKKYDGLSLLISNNLIKVQKGKSFLYFAVIDGRFHFLDRNGTIVNDFSTEKFGFSGIERYASGRGYIWSRTLPLLSGTILWGHGPDTFAMYYPQGDYMGKLKYMYDAYIIIDKPHNMYLQTAVNTGVLSLAALLIILGCYSIGSAAMFKKNTFEDFYSKTGFAVFVSVIGYLISGMSTDSTVSVAPAFWVLLGLGIGIWYKCRKPEIS